MVGHGVETVLALAWLPRLWRWLCERTKDLLYNTGNEHLDQARVLGIVFAGLAVFAVLWNSLHLGKEIDLAALLGGLTALAGGIAGLILGKEWARRKARDDKP